jgi:hypothetical protein
MARSKGKPPAGARALLAAIRDVGEAMGRRRAIAAARKLIEAHPEWVNATAPPEFPYPPLGEAIVANAPELTRLLLQRGADPNARLPDPGDVYADELGGAGLTPLHLAAAYRSAEAVEALLQHGADPNARDDHGRTPLFYAGSVWTGIRGAPVGVLDALVGAGADLRATDHAGQTVMDARGDCDADLAAYLADRHRFPMPLTAALALGRVDRVRELLADPGFRPPADRHGVFQAMMTLYGYSLFPPGGPNPSNRLIGEADAEAARRMIRDHLDILETLLAKGVLAGDRGHSGATTLDVLEQQPGPTSAGYRALVEAVRLIDPGPAELLLRHGVRPGSYVQTCELFNSWFHPRCRVEMVAMLARYGVTEEPPADFRDEVRGLCEQLRSGDEAARESAAKRLRELSALAGRRMRFAADWLRPAASDPSPRVRELVEATLGSADPPDQGPPMGLEGLSGLLMQPRPRRTGPATPPADEG